MEKSAMREETSGRAHFAGYVITGKKREREAEQLERIRIGYEEADRERDQKIEELEKRIQELSKNYDNNQDWEQEWRKIIGIKENEYLVRKPPEEEEDPWSDF
ncbi:hypothetical protein ACLZX5_00105 [Enterococcus faecium]